MRSASLPKGSQVYTALRDTDCLGPALMPELSLITGPPGTAVSAQAQRHRGTRAQPSQDEGQLFYPIGRQIPQHLPGLRANLDLNFSIPWVNVQG